MSLTKIHKEHLYTVDQVFKEDGKQQLSITLPYSEESFRITGDVPQELVEYANELILREIEKERAVTPYREAVKALSQLSLTQDGSGARAAAQVLLSAFNSLSFHVEIVDLCNLDTKNFKYAVDIIKGRVVTKEEPQKMIEGGDEIFRKLWEKWSHLSVDKRYSEQISSHE